MFKKSPLAKKRVPFIRLLLDLKKPEEEIVSCVDYQVHESRATRLVGDSRRFMTVSFTRPSESRYVKAWLERMTQPGKTIDLDSAKYVSDQMRIEVSFPHMNSQICFPRIHRE